MTDSGFLPGRKTTGAMARGLARHLERAHALALKHSQAVDAVAAALGYRNRHELTAAQNARGEACATPARLTAQQRLVLLYYAGGAQQDLPDRAAVTASGDTLLIAITELLDGAADDAAATNRLHVAGVVLRTMYESLAASMTAPEAAKTGEATLNQEIALKRTTARDGTDVAPVLRTVLAEARENVANQHQLYLRLAIARWEINKLIARIKERDQHRNAFGQCGHAYGRRLCEPHRNIDRFAVFITRTIEARDPSFCVVLPDGTAVTMPYSGRDPRWHRVDMDAVARQIAETQIERVTLSDVPIHLKHAFEIELNPRYADWFTPHEMWTLSPEAALDRLAAWADRVRPALPETVRT